MSNIELKPVKLFLLIVFAFFSLACFAQKEKRTQKAHTKKGVKHGYAEIDFIAGFASNNNSLGGGVNFGIKPSSNLSAGLGFEALKFKKFSSLYVPIYADFRYTVVSTKLFDVQLLAQPGYGFFSFKDDRLIDSIFTLSDNFIQQSGGFCFSGGISLRGNSKPALVLSLRYGFYQLNTKIYGDYFKDRNVGNINSIVLNVGIAF